MSELADYLQSHPEYLWALSESDDLKDAALKIIIRQEEEIKDLECRLEESIKINQLALSVIKEDGERFLREK
jgi:hypothetical protein